jgi:Tol biopolymer transport system component
VWTVGPAGRDLRQVKPRCFLKGDCDASGPAWAPDGKLIFNLSQGRVRQLDGQPQIQRSELLEYDTATGKQRTILVTRHYEADLIEPVVSPDGRTVVYRHGNSALVKPPHGSALFAVGRDGRGDHRLSPWELGGGDHATISPSGTVLFRSYAEDDSKQSDFWTMGIDGSQLAQLTHFPDGTMVRSASYSPDGRWIVHASNGVDGKADLYVMHADGTANRVLIAAKPWDSAPDWSPKR